MADMDDIKNYLHIDDDQTDELRQAEALAKTAVPTEKAEIV